MSRISCSWIISLKRPTIYLCAMTFALVAVASLPLSAVYPISPVTRYPRRPNNSCVRAIPRFVAAIVSIYLPPIIQPSAKRMIGKPWPRQLRKPTGSGCVCLPAIMWHRQSAAMLNSWLFIRTRVVSASCMKSQNLSGKLTAGIIYRAPS